MKLEHSDFLLPVYPSTAQASTSASALQLLSIISRYLGAVCSLADVS